MYLGDYSGLMCFWPYIAFEKGFFTRFFGASGFANQLATSSAYLKDKTWKRTRGFMLLDASWGEAFLSHKDINQEKCSVS